MKTIAIPKTSSHADICIDDPEYVLKTCHYLLTCLAAQSAGAIYAKWDAERGCAEWGYSEFGETIFDAPTFKTVLLKQTSLGMFRSILAHLGFLVGDFAYLGAGTFTIGFDQEPPSARLYAIMLVNERRLGYWVKLQMFRSA